jgi:uncharacterized membrane protein YjjP (DUF1212 family)
VGFVLRLARALHVHGYSAPRLEDVLGATSSRLGLHGHRFFSTPTSIMAAFGPEARQRTHLLRVEPGEVNLGKLAELEQLSADVALGRVSPDEGMAAITRIDAAPSVYDGPLVTLAHGVLSGAVCQFLGGGWREIGVATVLGLGLGVFSIQAARHPRLGRVFEPLAAFLVSALAIALARVAGPISLFIATLAGLIVLMPGLTLTTAISELATRNLASGTARISGAFMTLLGIVFGVALGTRLGSALFGIPPAVTPAALPGWVRSRSRWRRWPRSRSCGPPRATRRGSSPPACWAWSADASAPPAWAWSWAPSPGPSPSPWRAAPTSACAADPPPSCWCRGS